jgi:hypothetical protein
MRRVVGPWTDHRSTDGPGSSHGVAGHANTHIMDGMGLRISNLPPVAIRMGPIIRRRRRPHRAELEVWPGMARADRRRTRTQRVRTAAMLISFRKHQPPALHPDGSTCAQLRKPKRQRTDVTRGTNGNRNDHMHRNRPTLPCDLACARSCSA